MVYLAAQVDLSEKKGGAYPEKWPRPYKVFIFHDTESGQI